MLPNSNKKTETRKIWFILPINLFQNYFDLIKSKKELHFIKL